MPALREAMSRSTRPQLLPVVAWVEPRVSVGGRVGLCGVFGPEVSARTSPGGFAEQFGLDVRVGDRDLRARVHVAFEPDLDRRAGPIPLVAGDPLGAVPGPARPIDRVAEAVDHRARPQDRAGQGRLA